MAWPFDRRAAALAYGLSVVAVAATALTVSLAPVPRPDASGAFLDLLETGRDATARVVYSFERRREDGQRLDGEIVALHRGSLTLVSALGALSGRDGDRELFCTREEGREPSCLERAAFGEPGTEANAERDLLEGFGAVARAGHYAVTDDGSRTVAGEAASCFAVERRSEVPVPGATRSARYCFASDGVLLSAEVERPGSVDDRTASHVARVVDEGDVTALLDEFGATSWLR